MEDQLWILKSLNINAESLNATTSKEDVKRIQNEMTNQKSEMKMLYVTPEKLAKSKAYKFKLFKNALIIDSKFFIFIIF